MSEPPATTLGAGTTASKAWGEIARVLQEAGVESPVIDARLLVCHALGIDRLGLLREPQRTLGPIAEGLVTDVKRRIAREPVSRIVGARAFWGRDFRISPATLDPRADSETLVAAALELAAPLQAKRQSAPLRLLDLGTGTGCLLLTLLAELPEATGIGVDVSLDALAVARENGRQLGLEARARFVEGDWANGLAGPLDLVVSNPPYVRHGDLAGLAPEVAQYDPALALDGGVDGLDAYRKIVPVLPDLVPAGAVLFEVGAGQADAVQAMLVSAFQHAVPAAKALVTHRWQDLSGIERVVGLAT